MCRRGLHQDEPQEGVTLFFLVAGLSLALGRLSSPEGGT